MTCLRLLTPLLLLCALPSVSYAETFLTPWLGVTLGGELEDQNGQTYDLKPSESYAFSLEHTLDKGRIGLFYATQSTDVEKISERATTHYLHFQSSIYYPLNPGLSSYVGVGLGASYMDAQWVDDHTGFSASIFGGFDYQLNSQLSVNTQVRWLGTVVDNDTSGICNLPSDGSEQCIIRFKTDWMNQFSANIGLTWRF
ncbi:outer membrane beta-barrel protein [Vibrio cholerae]